MSDQEKIEKLAEFARWVIETSFSDRDVYAADVQDKADSLGLIALAPGGYDPVKHGEQHGEFEPGDNWYEFAPFLRRTK